MTSWKLRRHDAHWKIISKMLRIPNSSTWVTAYIYKNPKIWRAHFFLTLSHQGKRKLHQEKNLSFQIKAAKEMSQSPSATTQAANTCYYWRDKTPSFTLDMRGERFLKRPLKLDLLEIQQCQGNQLVKKIKNVSSSNNCE